MDYAEHIKNYILFLKRECGLYITLHPLEREALITMSELMVFNVHDNPYCVYVKSCDRAWRHCIERQGRIAEKCRRGAFFGKCYAGVGEFVYPIRRGDEILGFISVSGYKVENAQSFTKRVAETYHIPRENLVQAYSALKDETPERAWVDALLLPLCDMIELAYIKSDGSAVPAQGLVRDVLLYVKRYHTQAITLEQVSAHFGCSRSHVSHTFKKTVGRSFREYLTELRLNDAKSLLRHSDLHITEIALSVGFSDSAYFSRVFKRAVGVSPAAYRKNTEKGTYG